MKNFKPTVEYRSKLVNLDNIEYSEHGGQSRIHGLDLNNLKDVESSIEQVGLQEPICVEAVNIDSVDDSKSTYRLRSGCHRFSAYRNLQNKHKNSTITHGKRS